MAAYERPGEHASAWHGAQVSVCGRSGRVLAHSSGSWVSVHQSCAFPSTSNDKLHSQLAEHLAQPRSGRAISVVLNALWIVAEPQIVLCVMKRPVSRFAKSPSATEIAHFCLWWSASTWGMALFFISFGQNATKSIW